MRHCEAQSCNKVSGELPIDFFTDDGRIVAAAVLRAEKLLVSGGGRHQLLRCRGGAAGLTAHSWLRLHQTIHTLMSAEATTEVGVMVEAHAVLPAGRGGGCGFNALQAQPACGAEASGWRL